MDVLARQSSTSSCAAGRATDLTTTAAAELNPVEYVWGSWKQHELPNLCPEDFTELSGHLRRALARMPRSHTVYGLDGNHRLVELMKAENKAARRQETRCCQHTWWKRCSDQWSVVGSGSRG